MNAKPAIILLLGLFFSGTAAADLFLVKTSEGPGFTDPAEVLEVLEKGILPTFAAMQADKRIVAGGLPAGSRMFYLMVQAESHDEVDQMLRDIPAWGVFSWKVIPLQSISGRAEMEKRIVKELKSRK